MQHLESRASSWKTEVIKNHSLLIDPLNDVLDAYIKRRIQLTYDLKMNEKVAENLFIQQCIEWVITT